MRDLWSDRPNRSHNVSQKFRRIRRLSEVCLFFGNQPAPYKGLSKCRKSLENVSQGLGTRDPKTSPSPKTVQKHSRDTSGDSPETSRRLSPRPFGDFWDAGVGAFVGHFRDFFRQRERETPGFPTFSIHFALFFSVFCFPSFLGNVSETPPYRSRRKYGSTPPICTTIRPPFVRQCFPGF